MRKRRISGVHFHHGEDGRKGYLRGEQVPELLLDHIPDHPLGLGAEYVQRIGLDLRKTGRLEREKTDLGAVPMREDELVSDGNRGQRPCGGPYILSLHLGGQRLSTLEEGITPQRNHDTH